MKTIREWETLRIGGDGPSNNQAARLHAAAERAARRLKLSETAVLTRTHRGLRAGQVVGILSVPGQALEILPKIDGEDGTARAALVHMLAVAWGLRVADGELAALNTQRHDLLELLIRLFAERLLIAVRRGLPRRYLGRQEDLARLRGRLDIKRQFTHLAIRPDRLACRFDELSVDTPLNRVLKAAVSRLAGLAHSAENSRRLGELAARFEPVRNSSDPLGEPVHLDRTNTAFHDLHRLAKLLLSGEWQSTTAGDATGFTLLFPMNTLFEEFIGRSLRRALAPRPVELQHQGHHALVGRDGKGRDEGLFALRPDVVIGGSDTRPIVLDTKWKQLTPHQPRHEKTMGVDQSDIYQMLAYARAYNAKRLVLLYPWHQEMDEQPGLNRRWTVAGASSDCRLDIATIDVGCPDKAGRPDAVGDALRRIIDPDDDASPIDGHAPDDRAPLRA